MNEAFEQARATADVQINPRFSQPALGEGQASTMSPLDGAVSGVKNDPTVALLGGSAQ